MIGVGGPGEWPGADPLEAQLTVLGDLSDSPEGVQGVPFVPELAERGLGADPLGRTGEMLTDLAVELGPHGWKLADHRGTDAARAREFMRADLEALSISAASYSGPLTIQTLGPWTLAATLFLARGDRVLSDSGAVHDLSQSLAHGLTTHIEEVARLVPGARLTVQIDEHLLGQVQAGVLPTFSGYSRLRAVRAPDLIEGLQGVLDSVRSAGARSVVHVGSAWVGVPATALAGADAVGMDLGPWNEKGWQLIARALERGLDFWAGLPSAQISQCDGPLVRPLVDALAVPWQRIGLPTSDFNRVTLTQGRGGTMVGSPRKPGVSAGGVTHARGGLATLKRVAQVLAEKANT